jgi:Cd2+/Zn2+-exporting ATPase
MARSSSSSPDKWVEDLARFLRSEPGVEAVRLNPADRKVSVATLGSVDTALLDSRLAGVIAAIESRLGGSVSGAAPAGFVLRREGDAAILSKESCETAPTFWKWREFQWPEVDVREAEKPEDWRVLATLAAVCGVFGLLAFIVARTGSASEAVVKALYLVSIAAGGWDAAIDVVAKLKKREIDIHFLMLAVAVGAMSIGAWGEGALLLFLFSASGAMEEYALARTHRAVDSLLKSAPKQATVIGPDGKERMVPVEELRVGDTVMVKPGELFPVDAVVTKGRTAVDESNLTGEARPVDKDEGDPVFSGTINIWGVAEVSVQRLPAESTLQRIIRLIQTAQKLKAPSERFTDKFGVRYTYGILGGTAVMFLVWWLGFRLPAFENTIETTSAFYRAMTLLVVASPCALVLSIPSAILAAIAWGARHGILFRGGAAIERMADVNVALDKTGTLTTGDLEVIGTESFPQGREQEVLELACALESKSQHPIARAITQYGRKAGVKEVDVRDFQSITGQGVKGVANDATVVIGRRELLHDGPLAGWIKDIPHAAPDLSEVWVIGKGLLGRILLRDVIRMQSKAVLLEMRDLGLRTVMLTGDRRQAAESVARELGLTEVRAGLSPEQKVDAVVALGKDGNKVAMVGDGVNDAPSLAAAYVSVAMGARGSDAALEQSEVILMNDRIENFLSAFRLSHRARRIIRQNLVISLGTVVVMVAGALGGAVPLTIGVFAHEGSTVLVCLNSLRLLFGRDR